MSGYESLALFHAKYWWWMMFVLLATGWILFRLALNRPWSQEGMKALLCLNCAVVGVLYFLGVLSPAASAWDFGGIMTPFHWGRLMAFWLWLLAVLWLLDAFLARTPLALPIRPWRQAWVWAACGLALLFPLWEWVGNLYCPAVQMFGSGPVPLVLFSVALLGGSRPTTWLGRLLLILTAVLSLEVGLGPALASGKWHYLLAVLASLTAVIYSFPHRKMIKLETRA